MLSVRIPSFPLSTYVGSIWDYQADAPAHAIDRMLPNGQMGLIVNLRDDRIHVHDGQGLHVYSGSLIAGPYSRPFFIETAQVTNTMGVAFQPAAAAVFLGLPAGELLNTDLALADLWKSWAAELRERLAEAATAEQRLDLFESLLQERLARVRDLDRVVAPTLAYLERTPDRISVVSLARQFGLTSRRLAQLFETHVGLTPKSYHRLQRFRRLLTAIHGRRRVDWTAIAHDAGYYDQAHFNHHFREYTGLTPTGYLTAQGPHLNHVPLAD